MKAIVVYESLWGNTAAIALAIAEGIGPEARALSTAEATAAAIAGADLIVAGAPVHAFSLPTEQSRRYAGGNAGKVPPPDLSHPAMRSWLAALPPQPRGAATISVGVRPAEGSSAEETRLAELPAAGGHHAAFETAFKWSPSGATSAIMRGMERAGYRSMAKARRFIVTGGSGPLRAGEVEKARAWGAELAQAMR
jgi:hypothetical protein